MVKITMQVEGMSCGMCEAHVNEAIRKAFSVKDVTSSHSKRKTEILSDTPLDEEQLKAVVQSSGYSVSGIATQPYEKKGFSLFKK